MEFSPTFLYIKQHSITGKLYFGKSTRALEDMLKYLGSGKYWKDHINKHGKEHVVTLWYELFNNKGELVEFATCFSKSLNIVESNSWLNLIDENGLDGGFNYIRTEKHNQCGTKNHMFGKTHSIETRQLMSLSHKGENNQMFGKTHTEDAKRKISLTHKGKKLSIETINKRILSTKGSVRPKLECPYCKLIGGIAQMKRWHFNNCKEKENQCSWLE